MPKLKETLATVKTYYPDNHVLWLREAADYFNATLASEESLDLSNPFSELPLSLITKVRKEQPALTGILIIDPTSVTAQVFFGR